MSKRGNRTQYQNMIKACHAVGVRVIADTILNHMSQLDSGKLVSAVYGLSFRPNANPIHEGTGMIGDSERFLPVTHFGSQSHPMSIGFTHYEYPGVPYVNAVGI